MHHQNNNDRNGPPRGPAPRNQGRKPGPPAGWQGEGVGGEPPPRGEGRGAGQRAGAAGQFVQDDFRDSSYRQSGPPGYEGPSNFNSYNAAGGAQTSADGLRWQRGYGGNVNAVGSSAFSGTIREPGQSFVGPRVQGAGAEPLQHRGYGGQLGASQAQRPSFRGRGPKGYARSDERIREEICDRLTEHHDIDASDLSVEVSQGEVTLTGNVDLRGVKHMAEDVVESVAGVKEIHNLIRVRRADADRAAPPNAPAPTSGAAAGKNESDRGGRGSLP